MAHTASGFANGPATLERLRMGAELWRQTKLPLLVSGAGTWPGEPAAANLMAESLRTDFNVPVRWIEGKSRDTWENAQYSAAVLHGAGIHSVYLVTHAWHMKRALMAFARSGIVASPAPVPADLGPDSAIYRLLPHASAWDTSYVALHEAIGLVFYEFRHP